MDINMDTLSSSTDNILIPGHLSIPEGLTAHYNNGLNNILNCLAPVKVCYLYTKCPPVHPWTPVHQSQLEWLYRKSCLTVHKELYKTHLLHYKDSIAQTKSNYYSGLICSNEGNTKSLFSLLNKILQPPDSLPSHQWCAVRGGRWGCASPVIMEI